MGTARGRWVIAATVLGSGIVGIDATVVNVALPTIGRSFHAPLATLQWTVTAYVLTLSAFLLIGGALGDLYGRRRVFMIGVVWFALASLLCGVAPSSGVLVAARALQGLGAALLMPESLAILQSAFHPDDRGKAIGAWSGLGGIALAIGPFLGGWLIQVASWRLIFLINLPLVAVVLWIASRHVPESRDPRSVAPPRPDGRRPGRARLGRRGLRPHRGSGPAVDLARGAGDPDRRRCGAGRLRLRRARPAPPDAASGRVPLAAVHERQHRHRARLRCPRRGAVPHPHRSSRWRLGYSPLEAGVALMPITFTMLLLSARAGALARRIGPRIPMTLGPLVAGVGLALLYRVQPGSHYLTGVRAGHRGLRARPGADGGAADRHRAGGGAGGERRHRLGHQQRRRPGCRAHRRRRHPGGRGPQRQLLPAPGRFQPRLPERDVARRCAVRRRRRCSRGSRSAASARSAGRAAPHGAPAWPAVRPPRHLQASTQPAAATLKTSAAAASRRPSPSAMTTSAPWTLRC